MHHSLETINHILNGTADTNERAAFTDHLLDCEMCASRFKAMNELHRQASPAMARQKRMNQLRYAVGVAAVMTMAILPYFREGQIASEAQPIQVASHEATPLEVPQDLNNPNLALLDHVKAVNYQTAVQDWGRGQTVTDLIKLSE